MMSYIEKINNVLVPNITEHEVAIDLFTDCSGLSLRL
jgi:hypothetical protein